MAVNSVAEERCQGRSNESNEPTQPTLFDWLRAIVGAIFTIASMMRFVEDGEDFISQAARVAAAHGAIDAGWSWEVLIGPQSEDETDAEYAARKKAAVASVYA